MGKGKNRLNFWGFWGLRNVPYIVLWGVRPKWTPQASAGNVPYQKGISDPHFGQTPAILLETTGAPQVRGTEFVVNGLQGKETFWRRGWDSLPKNHSSY